MKTREDSFYGIVTAAMTREMPDDESGRRPIDYTKLKEI